MGSKWALTLGLVILLTCGGVWPGATCGSAQAAEQLTVGTVMPISGPLSILGMSFGRGFDLAAKSINEQGGITIDGRKYTVKLIHEDSKGSAEAARSATLKLIHKDKAHFVLGGILEPEIEAIYAVCNDAGAFFGAMNANIPGHGSDVTPEKKMQARLCHSFDDAHGVDIDYVKKTYPAVQKIAISTPDISYDPMVADFKARAEKAGLQVVAVDKWQWGTVDFLPVYTRILASKPDLIFAMISGQAQYQLMAARQLGFKGPFLSNAPLAPEVFINVAGADACTDLITNAVNIQKNNDRIKAVIDMWAKTYKDYFISDALLGYDGLSILAQGIQKAQSLDPKSVMAALESMTRVGDIDSLFGPARMGGMERFGHNRVIIRPIPISHFNKDQVVYADFIQP